MSAAQETPARGIGTDVAALRTLEPDRAFERMYRKHASEVYRYALAIVRDAADAEDVTQATFLNAFRALQRGDRPQKAKSWLLAIAHNVCLQRFRTASRRPQQVAFDEDLAEAVVPDEAPSADDLVRALQQLSFNQRSALVMRELEGRSYAEIGEILSLPVGAVETLLFRARRALREQLETSVTCQEAEELLSRQLDSRLPRDERGALRAHLRACPECAHLARSQRAQRSAWKALSIIPLPSSLFSGGSATVASGVGAKVAAVGVIAVLIGGGTYEGVRVAQSQIEKKPAKMASVVRSQAVVGSSAPSVRGRASTPAAVASYPGKALGRKYQHGKAVRAAKTHGRAAFVPQGTTSATHSNPHGRASAPGQINKTARRGPVRKPALAGNLRNPRKKKQANKKVTHPVHGGAAGQGKANGPGKTKGQTGRDARTRSSATPRARAHTRIRQ